MIWVTGAAGSVGSVLVDRLDAVGTDIEVDVTDRSAVEAAARRIQPDVILHCAGAKYAPDAESEPWPTVHTNTAGTRNILALGVSTVVASTCKAADPETVYGASKLIAERMTLNAGQKVARFYNVTESGGNVFRTWEQSASIDATPCWRYFISMDDAVRLMDACIGFPAGRYAVQPTPEYMPDLATRLYPRKQMRMVPPRRGDRIREPLAAAAETIEDFRGFWRIESAHDATRRNRNEDLWQRSRLSQQTSDPPW